MPLLTIFTPAYNRAHTLPRTYESLLGQDWKDFKWLIIDDGSTDGTEKLVQQWQKRDNGFEISYIYKDNGGMHTAHNIAYENIDTELNMCIDSDDRVSASAIKKIICKWNEIRDCGYAGIIGLDADMNTGEIIGKGFAPNLYETTLSQYYNQGGCGDKILVYRTDIIKKYPPYPVFCGEKYVALAYKYRLIDQDYKLSVLPEILCEVEYQEDGSSMNMLRQYISNPKGFAFWRKICIKYPISNKRKFIECIHYVSSSIFSKNKRFITESPAKLCTVLAIPFGIILTIYIKSKVR